jgi:hypothetical protein
MIFRHADIFQYLGNVTHAIFLAFIHAAKCALIMGAADGTLQQIAVGLAEGPENISFVSHVLLPVLNFFTKTVRLTKRCLKKAFRP